MYHYVYEITNLINGKKYIGKRSCKCPIEEDKYLGSGTYLLKAIKKYGRCNFKKEILEVCEDMNDCFNKEIYYIKKFNAVSSTNYYNCASGGIGGITNFASKTKKEMEHIRRKQSQSNIGKIVSEETRKLMSDVMKERCYWKGKKMPYSIRKKMSDTRKGIERPYEHYRKMIEAKKYVVMPKRENVHNSRKVVCLNTGEIFGCIRSVTDKYGFSDNRISQCCAGKRKSEGSIDGKRVAWAYYEDFKKMDKTEIDSRVKNANINNVLKKVICLNNGEVFESISEASRKYGFLAQNIQSCCKGRIKSAGKIDGEKAIWKYYEDYIKENNYEDK